MFIFIDDQFLRQFKEGIIDVGAQLGAGLDDGNILMSLFETLYVLVSHLNLILIFIALIGENHDLNVTSRVLFNFREPSINTEEAFFICQIAHYDYSISTLVIGICDCPVSFLPSGIPYLKFNCRLIDLQCSESLQREKGQNSPRMKTLLLYLQSQPRLCKCSSLRSNHPRISKGHSWHTTEYLLQT